MSKWTNILKTTKQIGEAGSSLIPIIKFVLGIAGVMSVLVFANSYIDQLYLNREYAAAVEQYKQRVAEASTFADSISDEIKFQERQAAIAAARNEELAEIVTVLQSERSSLRSALEEAKSITPISEDSTINVLIELQDSVIVQQDSIISTQESQITELNTIIERKDLSIHFLTESVDSLQNVVFNIPKPKAEKKYFGVIAQPSRTVVAGTMFITGMIVAAQFIK